MTASADFKAPAAEQMLLRGLLRGFLRLFFRSLVRPPMPVAGQAGVVTLVSWYWAGLLAWSLNEL